jgi:hypothetical protein
MGWVLRLVETGVDGSSRSVDVLEIIRPGDLGDLANRGLSVADGKWFRPVWMAPCVQELF